MALASDNYLHTTHRTANWFRKTFEEGELSLTPPYQRQAVWTNIQKAYLIDTILNGLPIPELYMQDIGDAAGNEEHVVVDGQQRIRAVLEFLQGDLKLEGPDVTATWRSRAFEELSDDQKRSLLNYKFVVRILPPELKDDEIRSVFSRINKNVVNLNDQELRNATYSGEFIKTIQDISDSDHFWSVAGVFTPNDHRRMLDQEFISELAIAYLHGLQNKKDKLDTYYMQYEESFERRSELAEVFSMVTKEIWRCLPELGATRWRKRSDFYTLFLEFAYRFDRLPLDAAISEAFGARIKEFGSEVDKALRLEDGERGELDANVRTYARNVSRAASDRNNRIFRSYALSRFVFGEDPVHGLPMPKEEVAVAKVAAENEGQAEQA